MSNYDYKLAIEKVENDSRVAQQEATESGKPRKEAVLIAKQIAEQGQTKARIDNANFISDSDPVTPLILDLDGDGVEIDGITHFDHGGDGWSELSRWAGEDDGVLVWDKNKDGIINDGAELFGNNSKLAKGGKAADGFAALADLDTNKDGKIDFSDMAWSELRVMRWADANKDGIMQAGERKMVTLESLGVKSLGTGAVDSGHIDDEGNEHKKVGGYTKTDGSTAKMVGVDLATNEGAAKYDDADIPEHSKAITALPDMDGGGRVYSLRDAMAMDDAKDEKGNSRLGSSLGYATTRAETRSLREMVADFTAKDSNGNPTLTQAARETLAEKILLRWAGAEGVAATNYGVSE